MNREARRRAERAARARQGGGPSDGGRLARALEAYRAGRLGVAEEACRELLARRPSDRPALQLLGHLLLHRAIFTDLRPNVFPAIDHDDPVTVGVALQHLERLDEAERVCREALESAPSEPRVLALLGSLLRSRGRFDEAVARCRRSLTQQDSAYAWSELGRALQEQDRLVEALTAFRRAVGADPANGSARLVLGYALLELGELDEAVAELLEARRLEPREPGPANDLGIALQRMGRYAESVAQFDEALALCADPIVRYNRSFSLLGTGDLAGGWDDYDLGFAVGGRTPDRTVDAPRWGGTPAPDAALLVWREQGVGDEIRFASCYRDAAEQVGELVVECDPRLRTLLARSFPMATVRAERPEEQASGVDLHCPAGSLPRYLRRSIDDFPDEASYLRADPAAVARWRARLEDLGPGLKVGWSWRSGNLAVTRLGNYTVPEEWRPLLELPGVQIMSLQYGSDHQVEEEIATLQKATGVVVHRWPDVDYTDDFDALAALTSALDLVVGVTTTPLMLAGALGVPVHMISPPHPLAFGKGRFPWMPSVRLHTRAWDEPWERPISEVAAVVAELAAGR